MFFSVSFRFSCLKKKKHASALEAKNQRGPNKPQVAITHLSHQVSQHLLPLIWWDSNLGKCTELS